MDQLEAMRAFVTVAESPSLSAAARRLGTPVASISRKLAALESHLGARLLTRSTRKMALTEPGERYVAECQRILDALDEADRVVSAGEQDVSGNLAVTAPVAFGRLHVVPVVAEMMRAHPALRVQLTLADRVIEMIGEGVDVAVRIAELPDSTLQARRVGTVARILCASPDYLSERGAPETPEGLAVHDCIAAANVATVTRWPFRTRHQTRSVEVQPKLTISTAEAAIDAAAAGLGITRVYSYQAAAAIAEGRLVRVLEGFEPAAVPVQVVHGEGRSPRAKVREFVKLAATRLRERLADV